MAFVSFGGGLHFAGKNLTREGCHADFGLLYPYTTATRSLSPAKRTRRVRDWLRLVQGRRGEKIRLGMAQFELAGGPELGSFGSFRDFAMRIWLRFVIVDQFADCPETAAPQWICALTVARGLAPHPWGDVGNWLCNVMFRSVRVVGNAARRGSAPFQAGLVVRQICVAVQSQTEAKAFRAWASAGPQVWRSSVLALPQYPLRSLWKSLYPVEMLGQDQLPPILPPSLCRDAEM